MVPYGSMDPSHMIGIGRIRQDGFVASELNNLHAVEGKFILG